MMIHRNQCHDLSVNQIHRRYYERKSPNRFEQSDMICLRRLSDYIKLNIKHCQHGRPDILKQHGLLDGRRTVIDAIC